MEMSMASLTLHQKTAPRLLPAHQSAQLCSTVGKRLEQRLTMAQGSSSAPSMWEFPSPQPLEACPALGREEFAQNGHPSVSSSQPQEMRLILTLPPAPLEEGAPG